MQSVRRREEWALFLFPEEIRHENGFITSSNI